MRHQSFFLYILTYPGIAIWKHFVHILWQSNKIHSSETPPALHPISVAVAWQHFQRVKGYHTYPLLYLAFSFPLFPQITLLSLKTPSLWQAWQGNFVLSSVTQGQGTTSCPCLFHWENSCPFRRNIVRNFLSFVSLCWISYSLASWVFCPKDGWRVIVMSSLLPITSITHW